MLNEKLHLERNDHILRNYFRRKENVLKVVVTDGTTDLARAFLYRMLNDNVFGENQSVFVSLYELPNKATFLESVVIELTSFSPKVLNGKYPCSNKKKKFTFVQYYSVHYIKLNNKIINY